MVTRILEFDGPAEIGNDIGRQLADSGLVVEVVVRSAPGLDAERGVDDFTASIKAGSPAALLQGHVVDEGSGSSAASDGSREENRIATTVASPVSTTPTVSARRPKAATYRHIERAG